MNYQRATGVLCHISSLPGKYGIGSLGKEAYRFAKKLVKSGVKYWQVLPLVQTGFGDSPYSSVSCDSGNPYFIDLDDLAKQGLLTKAESLEKLRTDYHEEYLFWQFLQYEFWKQWFALKDYCNQIGLKIIGDIALYVAYDSADVWANPDLFKLDKKLRPEKVAGVPPDYFSATGQLWGNPVYDWKEHKKDGYAWWKKRLQSALKTYDLIRIDHFRGLERYYEIPYGAKTAETGVWKDGPKDDIFEGIDKEVIIAEDLGVVDDGVKALLEKTGFPGMKVLLFAFDGNPENPFLPKNISENSVCYTGTHDNDTVAGYIRSLSAEEFILLRSRIAATLAECRIYLSLGGRGERFPEAFVRLALSSKARLAILPVQDILGYDNRARMNEPGTLGGNWTFRLEKQPDAIVMKKLKKMNKVYRR